MYRPTLPPNPPTWLFMAVLVPFLMLPLILRGIFYPVTVSEPFDPVQQEIRRQLEYPNEKLEAQGIDRRRLWIFYHTRTFKPVWSRHGHLLPYAREFRTALEGAWADGLEPAEYHLKAIKALWAGRTPAALTMLDLLLTHAFLAYSEDLHSGVFRAVAYDPQWHIVRRPFYAEHLLRSVSETGAMAEALKALRPPHEAYRRLIGALAYYRALAREGEWPQLPPGPVIALGARDVRVPILRERLRREGYHGVASRGLRYDAALAEALARFQRRHGLQADGQLCEDTRAALNVSLAERIRQLWVNMERWRWMPGELGKRHILVNISGFYLQLVDAEAEGVDVPMKVIIGRQLRETPSFLSPLTHLIVNPYWNVPATIAAEDLLPQLQRNPRAVAARGFRFFRSWSRQARAVDPLQVNWQRVDKDNFPYKVRQAPGPDNSLGQVKFMMHNDFEIYLHDTPDRHLFERSVRSFSSGCIRVEQPIALAAWLSGQSDEAITALVAKGKTRLLPLDEAVPVYLGYWTSWVDDEAKVQFRRDIYGRNRLMLAQLRRTGKAAWPRVWH